MRLSKMARHLSSGVCGSTGELFDPCTFGSSILVGKTDFFTESNYAGNKNSSASRSQRGNMSSALGRQNIGCI